MTGSLPDNLTLALGTGEVRLIDMAAAYAALLNGGMRVRATGIERMDVDGKAQALDRAGRVRVIEPEIATEMRQMLAAVVARGSGRAAALPGRFVAGKNRDDAGLSRRLVHRRGGVDGDRGLAGQ